MERAKTGTRDSAWWRARRERIAFVMALCGLKLSKNYASEAAIRLHDLASLFDHSRIFRHASGILCWDDPYIKSWQISQEYRLKARGMKIMHLPLQMSLHVRGECQPRLTGFPNVNLEHIARLLTEARFETPLTRAFVDESYRLADAHSEMRVARVTGPTSDLE